MAGHPKGHARPGRRRADPILIIRTVGERQIVAACCPIAASRGVHAGMTLAHAQALAPEALKVDHAPEADRRALRALAARLLRFSPIVGLDLLDDAGDGHAHAGLLLDIAGCEHLFGGEPGLLSLLSLDLGAMGIGHRIGVAPTIGLAWALARTHPSASRIVATPSGDPERFLRPLDIAGLRLPSVTLTALREMGLRTIGNIIDLPRACLPSRFGLLLARRLDQAAGRAFESIEPVRVEPPLRLQRVFDGPTTRLDAVELAARELLDLLEHELLRRGRGVTRLRLTLLRVRADARSTEQVHTRIALSRPTRSPRHLWSLLRPRLEKAPMGLGVEGICLSALAHAKLPHTQTSHAQLSGESPGDPLAAAHTPRDPADVAPLIDTLVARLGTHAVRCFTPADSHIPEHALRTSPAMATLPSLTRASSHAQKRSEACSDTRPPILFDTPEPAQAIFLRPDHPPSRLTWRGEHHAVRIGIGPERIDAQWWRGPPSTTFPRDYYRLQLETGLWIWAFRDPSTWHVHGVWG